MFTYLQENFNLRPAFVLVFLFALVIILWLPDADKELQRSQALTGEQPKYYTKDFMITDYNAKGVPERWLQGERLLVATEGEGDLTQPRLKVQAGANGQSLWLINASHGLVLPDNKISLDGDVRVSRNAGPDSDAMRIDTEYLLIDMSRQHASSNQDVVVRHISGKIKAKGLDIDIQKQVLVLPAQVRGVYEVN